MLRGPRRVRRRLLSLLFGIALLFASVLPVLTLRILAGSWGLRVGQALAFAAAGRLPGGGPVARLFQT